MRGSLLLITDETSFVASVGVPLHSSTKLFFLPDHLLLDVDLAWALGSSKTRL